MMVWIDGLAGPTLTNVLALGPKRAFALSNKRPNICLDAASVIVVALDLDLPIGLHKKGGNRVYTVNRARCGGKYLDGTLEKDATARCTDGEAEEGRIEGKICMFFPKSIRSDPALQTQHAMSCPERPGCAQR